MNIFAASHSVAKIIIPTKMLVAAVGTGYFLYTGMYQYFVIALLFGIFLVQIAHHVGLHRYFSHRSFETNKFWHAFLCLFTPLMCSGSAIEYAVLHRAHHAHSDQDLDPHAPALGFYRVANPSEWNLQGINLKFMQGFKDPWIQFAHNWYLLIIFTFCMLLALIDPLLLFAYSISLIWAKAGAIMTNYFSHMPNLRINYRNFDTADNSQNSLVTGWLFGEWHNNHHADPRNWNQKVKWWEWDMAAVIINWIKINDKIRT